MQMKQTSKTDSEEDETINQSLRSIVDEDFFQFGERLVFSTAMRVQGRKHEHFTTSLLPETCRGRSASPRLTLH